MIELFSCYEEIYSIGNVGTTELWCGLRWSRYNLFGLPSWENINAQVQRICQCFALTCNFGDNICLYNCTVLIF